MEQSAFGLPPEYQHMPEFFDAQNEGESNEDAAVKNAVVERLLKEQQVETVLDMTCGTGSQVFYLTERGYNVTGSDFSPALLEQARKKALAYKQDIRFIDGDMRHLHVGTFDAVITMFNAIGHLTKANFEQAMRNIHGNLKEGGIYLFDILNLDAMTDDAVADLDMLVRRKVGDTMMHLSQFSTLDRENGLLTSYNHYSFQTGVEKPRVLQSHFTLQVYTAGELNTMLARNGFETLRQYDIEGNGFIANKSLNILTMARKK